MTGFFEGFFYGQMKMNIYKHQFALQCPANDEQIIYDLEIRTQGMIYAEHIVSAVLVEGSEYHETLADRIFGLFGGEQIIKAIHHGVSIETRRGF